MSPRGGGRKYSWRPKYFFSRNSLQFFIDHLVHLKRRTSWLGFHKLVIAPDTLLKIVSRIPLWNYWQLWRVITSAYPIVYRHHNAHSIGFDDLFQLISQASVIYRSSWRNYRSNQHKISLILIWVTTVTFSYVSHAKHTYNHSKADFPWIRSGTHNIWRNYSIFNF